MEPTVNIGKSGLTDAMVDEIKKQLKRHRTVRVKVLNSASDRKAILEALPLKTGAKIKSKIGFTAVLYMP